MNAPPFTTHAVSSADGTTIGYRQLGQGPGLVLLHGSMSSGYYHLELAEALGDAFTLYLPDRRGRGISGAYRDGDGIKQEVQDLEALLAQTGARQVCGVSVGAVIALRAALTLPAISKLALYEPMLLPDAAAARGMMTRFDREMAAGQVTAALSTALKGGQMGSPVINAMPHWLLSILTRPMANWTPGGEYIAFADLAPTLHYEGHEIVTMSGSLDAMKDVQAEVLLLGGSKSSALLKNALTRVEHAVPGARRIELPGLGHSSPWNKQVRGKPGPVARALRDFFQPAGPAPAPPAAAPPVRLRSSAEILSSGLFVADGLDLERDAHRVGDHEAARRQRDVTPLQHVEVAALYLRGRGQAESGLAPDVRDHAVRREGQRDRAGDAVQRQVPVEFVAAARGTQRHRGEVNRGELRRVQDIGAEYLLVPHLVGGRQGGHVNRSPRGRQGKVIGDGDRSGRAGRDAACEGDREVLDRERDPGVCRVDRPRTRPGQLISHGIPNRGDAVSLHILLPATRTCEPGRSSAST
jgi:pimeloyl-ACP methyl ester carboxylesterase